MIKNVNFGINKMESKYLKYKQKYLDLKELIGGSKDKSYRLKITTAAKKAIEISLQKRILVFTDIGEECDDEAALYILFKNMFYDKKLYADIVLCTGNTMNRYKRFYYIFNKDPFYTCVKDRVKIYKLVDTKRHVGYVPNDALIPYFSKFVESKPLNSLIEYQVYDIILQISPFVDAGELAEISKYQVDSINKILDNIKVKDNCILVIVGDYGSTNYPKDDKIHNPFVNNLKVNKKVKVVNVNKYRNWSTDYVNNKITVNDELKQVIKDNEFKKVVGRILPTAANYQVRFNVNCSVNYNIVDKIYKKFITNVSGETINAVETHFNNHINNHINNDIKISMSNVIQEEYIDKIDLLKEPKAPNSQHINDAEPVFSQILSRSDNSRKPSFIENNYTLDKIMLDCIFDMTKKIIIMWLIIRVIDNKTIVKYKYDYFQNYLINLNYSTFPDIHADITSDNAKALINIIMDASIGSPQYDGCGMVHALSLICETDENKRVEMITNINNIDISLTDDILARAYKGMIIMDNIEKKFKEAAILHGESQEAVRETVREAARETERKRIRQLQ